MKLPFKKRSGSQRGSALIELALSSLVLIPVLFGTFQFGYTFYIYNLLCTQINASAKYAAMRTFRCADSTSITKFKTATANMVRFGNPDGSGALIEPGLTAAEVDVQIKDRNGASADATHLPTYVTVSTLNYSVNAVFTTFTFTSKPILRVPYVGRFAPAELEP